MYNLFGAHIQPFFNEEHSKKKVFKDVVYWYWGVRAQETIEKKLEDKDKYLVRPWDFPEPDEDPKRIWKELKDAILTEHKKDTANDIWKDLKDAVLPKHKQDTANKIWKDLKNAVIPEHKQDTANDIWEDLKAAFLPKADNEDHEDSYKASIPEIRVTAPTPDSERSQSNKEGEYGDASVEEPSALIPEIKVTEPTRDAKPAPTSGQGGATDVQQELDTPSTSEAKGEKKEGKDEENNAPISKTIIIEGFGGRDVADFLSLGDNGQVREKLEAILREDESNAKDDGPKLKKQWSWTAEIKATFKLGSISKDSSSEEEERGRELSRIRTELDSISRRYKPNTPGSGTQLKKQASWTAEVRAWLKPGSVSESVQEGEKVGGDNPTKEPKPDVASDTKKRKDALARKSILTWAAEVEAASEPAPITESATSSETIKSTDAQPDERNDSSEKTESAQVKGDGVYLDVGVETRLALAAVTKSLPSIETECTQTPSEPDSGSQPAREPETSQPNLAIDAWVANVETAMKDISESELVPDEERETSEQAEKQDSGHVIDGSKKPNWSSSSQGTLASSDSPNPPISWDFWAEKQDDTPEFKEACHTKYDIFAYPMSLSPGDVDLGYQFGDCREDFRYESFNEGPQVKPNFKAIKHLRRRGSVSTNSSLVNMGKAVWEDGEDAKADQ